MPVYSYTFRDAAGGIQKGTAEAESEELLRKRFEEQGFTITEVTMLKSRGPRQKNYGKVKLQNLSIFCRQFSTMVDAGVSLVRCLDVLGHQTQDPKLKKILMDIGERVEGGESLSRAMRRHPKAFNNLFLGLIRAGEVGGVLEESLQRLAHFLEKDVELRREVKSAMTYPVLVMVLAGGIVTFLVTWFIPQWADILKDLGLRPDQLPAPTKFLIDLSNVIKYYTSSSRASSSSSPLGVLSRRRALDDALQTESNFAFLSLESYTTKFAWPASAERWERCLLPVFRSFRRWKRSPPR